MLKYPDVIAASSFSLCDAAPFCRIGDFRCVSLPQLLETVFNVGKLTDLVYNDRSDLKISIFLGVVVEFVRCLAGLGLI